jgi:hypothetical protein
MTGLPGCEPMAKTKDQSKRSSRDDMTVKIDRGVGSKAKMVAAARKITLAQYLTELTRSLVDRDFAKEMHRVEKGEPKA